MKTIIAGGRNYQPTFKDEFWIDRIHTYIEITEIVSGTAKGADQWGEYWAYSRGIPVKRFPANWVKYGRGAGPIRNQQMAEYANALILFPGGKGSANMREQAIKQNLVCFFYEDFVDLIKIK